MIDSTFHVEINGKKYTLAEDGEGTHYQWKREPLRAPTNGFVLGDTGKFNLRPDLLEWQISDWSGGEGVHSFDPDAPNAYSLGYNIDPFTVYGTLRLSPHATLANQIDGGSGTFEQSVMTLAFDGVVLISHIYSTSNVAVYKYNFDDEEWNHQTTSATNNYTDAGAREAWGDPGAVYFGGQAAAVVKYDGAFVVYPGGNTNWAVFHGLGGYLYCARPTANGLEVMEAALDGSLANVEVFNIAEARNAANQGLPLFWDAIAGQNALYIAVTPSLFETVLYRITPTTAAGAGFGEELIRVPGLRGIVPMYTLGLLYVAGLVNGPEGYYPTLFYYDEVNGSVGVAFQNTRRIIAHQDTPSRNLQELAGGHGGEFSRNHFAVIGGPDTNDGTDWTMMTLDAVSGGVAGGTVINVGTLASNTVDPLDSWLTLEGNGLGRHSVVYFRGDVFLDISRTANHGVIGSAGPGESKIWRLKKGTYTSNLGIFESSVNDLGILADKVLTSFTLLTDPLPASSSVTVKYQLDQDGTWLTAGTFSTNGGTEETFIVSNDSTTRRFRNLQIRLELDNGDVTTETPIVRSIRALATVIEGVNTWSLMLNATDELGAMQDRSWSGATLIDNITDAANMNSVVSFKDGYTDRKPGSSREYDVVIDEYSVVNDRPGEGMIQVNLREVT